MSEGSGAVISSKDLEGKVYQEYRLEQLVGKGGMAWVYKATHVKFGETMAVKVLLPHLSDDEDIRRRFLEEAKIQFKLRHSHIVQVTDIIEVGKIYGFVMEWAEGKNLKQILDQLEQPISRKDIWRIMGPIIDAVGYAHQQGLVHRDIKPANILLHQDGGKITPKMADFGIAKALDDEEGKTQTGMTMGTLKFMPPEQIRDAKRVDHRADVYALGVTLYLMSTLRLPFEGRQEFVIFQQMNQEPPLASSRNPKISPALDRVIMKALAREPENRFQSCAEFGHALSLALIDPDNIKADSGDLDTHKIYNMLSSLPEENSIYQTSLTPLSPTLVQELYSSHTSDTITKLQKFVLEGDPAHEKARKLAGIAPETELSTKDMESDTILHTGGLSRKSSSGGPNIILLSVLIAVLLLAGGGAFYAFVLRKPGTTPQTPPPPVQRTYIAAQGCQNGTSKACYTGPQGTRNRGVCKAGTQFCKGGAWGPCEGQVLPAQESCNGKDNNCDGKVDENFPNKGKACSIQEGDCRFSGLWICGTTRPQCAPDPNAKPDGSHIKLQITKPTGRSISIQYDGKTRNFQNGFCISLQQRQVRVKLKSRGYNTCAFRLNKRKKTVRIRLKPFDANDLAPPLNYCVQ